MAKVKVASFTVVRDVLGKDVIEIEVGEPETVGGLLSTLLSRYGQPLKDLIWDRNTGKMEPFLLALNGAMILRNTVDMEYKIKDGDEIAIVFPLGGG